MTLDPDLLATLRLMADAVRVLAYAVVTCGFTYLYFDDRARGLSRRWLWAALCTKNGAVLLLLALDLQDMINWFESRWLLTPTAVVSAIALTAYVRQKYVERHRVRRQLDRLEEVNGYA